VHLTGLDLFLWALTFIEHCALLAVLLYFRRASRFPVFTTLIAFDVLRTIALFFTLRFGTADNYFYAYWSFAIVDVALQLAVAYELAGKVFRPLGSWAPEVRQGFAILISVSLLIAVGLTWLATPPTPSVRSTIVIRGDFFSSALMSELFVAMVVLSVTLGLPWRTHVARIAQGFGVYSIFTLITEGAHNYFGLGKHLYASISRGRIVLYCVCVAYWTVSLALKEPETRELPPQLRRELSALQQRVAKLLQGFREMRSA
jgi:hypothetical protein